MSFEPPAGILDIGNATLRVGKLEVAETTGLNQGLQNVIKNDLLVTEKNESSPYTTNQTWGLKLPTAWVGEFEIKGQTGKYVEFNFYNEGSTSNAQGYTLNFKDTSLTLKYDNGNTLATATIPTIVGTFRKVNIFFERSVIAVSIDGIRYLYYKESDTFNQGLGVASRVVSTTGSAFVNVFFESDHGGNSQFKNLRIVNGRFISDNTSNVSFIGSLGVGVHSPKESLDIHGNMHLTRVSNVSQVSVDSNVVTEYTGPHDRPLRKYPEVVLTADDNLSTSGYKASVSSLLTGQSGFNAFDATGATTYWHSQYPYYTHVTGTYNPGQSSAGTGTPSGTLPTTELISGHQGEWIKLQMPKKIKLEEVRVYASNRAASSIYQMPKDIAIAGSNDGTNWYLVDSGTLRTGIRESYGMASLPVTTSSYYSYLALIVKTTDNQGENYSAVEIANIEYYGYEEGSGSLDTTLKTVFNVPATTGTQLEVYYDGQDYTDVTSTVNDKVGTATNATITNTGSTITFDSTYKAWTFGGSSSRTDTFRSSTLPSTFTGNQVHSITLWFNMSNISDGSIFVITPSTGENGGDVIMGQTQGNGARIAYSFWGNDVSFALPTNLTTETWYHLSMTYDATDNSTGRKMFLNGIECTAINIASGSLSLPNSNMIISFANRVSQTSYPFFGSIANFRLYSKALNADQVKELYDYQKDYFFGSKSQVTMYKGHLGVGVTEPSGQLELAGDEGLQQYPPRSMTDYDILVDGHGAFCVSASSELNSAQAAWEAFSYNVNDNWICSNQTGHTYDADAGDDGVYLGETTTAGIKGEWVQMKTPYKVKIASFNMDSYADADSNRQPKDFTLLGSNDGNVWEQLKSFTNITSGYTGTLTGPHHIVNSTKYYTYFRLVITAAQDDNDGITAIKSLKFFGTPGPTTLDKGSLTLGRSLDVPRVSRYDVDTETPRPEKLLVDYDTTVNSSPTDISGRGSHGSFVGDASYSAADKAFNFTGVSTGDMIVASMPTSSGDNTLSVSFWYKRTSTTGTHCPVRIGDPSQGQAIAMDIYNNGTVYWFIYSGKNFLWTGVSDTWFPLNTWTHVVCVHTAGTDFANLNEVYINGVPQSSTATFGGNAVDLSLDAESDDLVIGARSTGTNHAIGQISNFKVYSVTLEPSEIKKLYRLGRTGRSMVISDTAVGIGKVPEAQLDVRGNLKVGGAIQSKSPAWSLTKNNIHASGGSQVSAPNIIGWNKINSARGCRYDSSTGKIHVPITGLYLVGMYAMSNSDVTLGLQLYINGSFNTTLARGVWPYQQAHGGAHNQVSGTAIVSLNAGDDLSVYLQTGNIHASTNAHNQFWGYFIG